MELHQFLCFRVAFSGLPYGELEAALDQMRRGAPWSCAFDGSARRLCRLAGQAQRAGRTHSAGQGWRWAASAFHAASLSHHVETDERTWRRRTLRLRRLAVAAYGRALLLDWEIAERIRLSTPVGEVTGYLRRPRQGVHGIHGAAPLVVLFNGLDSLCEVELHVFGNWLQEWGLGVLALDLPAAYGSDPRTPVFAVEQLARTIADWAAGQEWIAAETLGTFGVSFGGHLAARLLAGDPRFVAGVAVSPNAFVDRQLLGSERMRRMLALSFALPDDPSVDELAARLRLDAVEPPAGALLVLEMEHDQLFGPEHTRAFRDWGGDAVEVQRWTAEHVGTSRVHEWLPVALDWLAARVARPGTANAGKAQRRIG